MKTNRVSQSDLESCLRGIPIRFCGSDCDGRTGEKYFAPTEQRKPPPIRAAKPPPETAADPAGAKNISPLRNNGNRRRFRRGHGDGRAKNISPLRNNGNRRRFRRAPWRRAYGRKIFRPCGTTETAADSGGAMATGVRAKNISPLREQRKPPPIPAGPWRRAYGRKIRKKRKPPPTRAAMATGVRAKNISPLRKTANRRRSGGRPWRRAYGRKIFRPCGTTGNRRRFRRGHGDGRTGEKYFAPTEKRKPPPTRAAMATGVRAKNISPLRNNGNRRRFRAAMATGVRAKNISPLRNNGNRRQSGRPTGVRAKNISPLRNNRKTAAEPGAAMATGVGAKNISPLRNNGNRRRFRRGHGDGRTGEKYFAPTRIRECMRLAAGGVGGRTGEKYFAPTQIREPSAIYGCDLQKPYDEEW